MSSTAATVASLILTKGGYSAGQGAPADAPAAGGFDNQLQTARQAPGGEAAPTMAHGHASNPLAALLQQGAEAALADGTGGNMSSTGTTLPGAGAASIAGKPGNGATAGWSASGSVAAAATTSWNMSPPAEILPLAANAAAATAQATVDGAGAAPSKPSGKPGEAGDDKAAAALAGAMLAALGQLAGAALPSSASAAGTATGKAAPAARAAGVGMPLSAATRAPGAAAPANGLPVNAAPMVAEKGTVGLPASLSAALAAAPGADTSSSAGGAPGNDHASATVLLDAQLPSLSDGGAASSAGATPGAPASAPPATASSGQGAPPAAAAFVNLLNGVPVPALAKHAEPVGLAALLPPTAATGTATAPPMHALSLANPPGTPAFTQELSQQIAWLGGQEITQARIRLHPQDLGQLDVKVSVQPGGQVDLSFAVQHPAVVHALQQTLPQLNTLLAQHGLSLGQTQVGQQQAGREGASYAALAGGAGAGGEDGEPVAAITGVPTVVANGLLDTFA